MATITIKGIIGQDYTYKQFITDYAACGDELIRLAIDSPGGYVTDGEQIAAFIKSHSDRFESVINDGDIASIASAIFLALPFDKRFFNLNKGVALIHNPFLGNTDGLDTTAAGLKVLSEEMQQEENKIAKFIIEQTGADADVIRALMAINEPLTESQLNSIKFANIIKYQAVAYLKQEEQMDNKELKEHFEKTNSILDKIVAFLKPKAISLMLTDANGNQIEFPDLQEGGEVKVGDKVTAEDGEIVMADGSTIVVKGGMVEEIKPAIQPATQEMEDLKKELEALKAEKSTWESEKATMNALSKEVLNLKSQIKSQMVNLGGIEKPEEGKEERRTANLREKLK